MTKILDGKIVSDKIKSEIKSRNLELINSGKRPVGLALLIIGYDGASQTYVASKEKACLELGFHSIVLRKEENTSEFEILSIIDKWNNDSNIDGILVQLPLPKHIDEDKVIQSIHPDKDVDGFHPINIGKLVIGLNGIVSCTPAGILELIKFYNIETKGKHVVVVGRSNIVGKPIANLLYQKYNNTNATVTICHSYSFDLPAITQLADILICAIGVPEMIDSRYIKEGAVVIDVGISRVADSTKKSGYRVTGDVNYNDVFEKCSAITPVPGGIGAMTIAMLMSNALKIRLNK